MAAVVVVAGCSSDAGTSASSGDAPARRAAGGADAEVVALRGPTSPTEHVGLTTQIPTDRASFDEIASQLFGEQASEGRHLDDLEVGAGLHLSSAAHPTADDEVALTVALDTTGAKPPTRTVASVPASTATGKTFIDAVDADLAPAVEAEGIRCVVTDTIMSRPGVGATLATVCLQAGTAGAPR